MEQLNNKFSNELFGKLISYVKQLVQKDEEKFTEIEWDLLSIQTTKEQKLNALNELEKLGPIYVEEAMDVLDYVAKDKQASEDVREKCNKLLDSIKGKSRDTTKKGNRILQPITNELIWATAPIGDCELRITPQGNTNITSKTPLPLHEPIKLLLEGRPVWKGEISPTVDLRVTRSIRKASDKDKYTYSIPIDSSLLGDIANKKEIDLLIGNKKIHLNKKIK